ncbi:hypothetical protein FHP29_16350 [Nocardioides albidus]|uniref:Recombinase family protein n=1 Tax=Nocardioides albidus TaxID=1517589 RepID=A0A5C4VNG4_9ACTN|nr:recombinase family protein [Nocardioides albidus]TNM37402.1 hypothetical protein FHP29_16350 [Nocardioides albidus]
MRAAIYCRVSTAEQIEGTSLDEQERKCRAYADSHGWTVADGHVYIDPGISGTDPNRPEWRRMLAAAGSGAFDVVIVSKLDRFSRSAGHAQTEIRRLVDFGVQFVSLAENLDLTTPQGRAMLGVMATFAELERDTIAQRAVDGQRALARQGRWPGGTAPFGWRIEGSGKGKGGKSKGEANDVRLVPDERERDMIRIAVETIEGGGSTADVALLLNAQGYHGRGNGANHPPAPWNHQRVREMLQKRALMGWTAWGKETRKQRGNVTKMKRDGTPLYGDSIPIELPDPPLSEERWLALQNRLAQRASGPKTAKATYPNSLAATPCGGRLGGIKFGDRPRSYRCTGMKWKPGPHEKCGCKVIRADWLDFQVWHAVVEVLSDPERLLSLAADYIGFRAEADEPEADTVERIRRRIETLEKNRREKVVEYLRAGIEADLVNEAVAQVDAEIDQARAVLVQMEAHRADAYSEQQRARSLEELARHAAERLPNMTLDEQAEVLRLLRVKVSVLEQAKEPSLSVEGVVPGGVDLFAAGEDGPQTAPGGPWPPPREGCGDETVQPARGGASPPPTSRAIRSPSTTRSPTGSASRSLSRSRQSPNRPDTW